MIHLFTSESVSEGHPDKLADQVSDAILDAYLAQDPNSKVACETLVTHKGIIVAGEIHSSARLKKEIEPIIRKAVSDVGYDSSSNYEPDKIWIKNLLHEQSHEIRKGVDNGGAGDQGLMFGYACDETPEFMPLAISLSHRIVKRLAELRKKGTLPWLLPDAKSQVTLIYEDDKPIGIDKIVVSTQHMPFILNARGEGHVSTIAPHGHYSSFDPVSQALIREKVIEEVIMPLVPPQFDLSKTSFLVNPSGSFEIGGPVADTGLTGRKIIVDTYGGSCPHGGGAFSGKDPSKVDRSAAYAARHIAKNLVAAGVCKRVVIQLSYAIGVAEPTSLYVNTLGTTTIPVSDEELSSIVKAIFTLTPKAIAERMKLRNPIYLETSSYGHMGRKNKMITKSFTFSSGETLKHKVELFTWEKLDYVDAIRNAFNL